MYVYQFKETDWANYHTGLRVIHKAGWIHRDISPGNIYLYTDPITKEKRGLIGDLEYAKRAGDDARSRVRTVCFFYLYEPF